MFSHTSGFELKNRVLHLLSDLLERAINSSHSPNLENLEKNKEKLVDDFITLIKKHSTERVTQLNVAKMVELTGISEEEICRGAAVCDTLSDTKNLGEALTNYRKAKEDKDWTEVRKAIKQVGHFFME